MADNLGLEMQHSQVSMQPKGHAAHRRSIGRALLALLIACSISLSFFHGWTADAEADEFPIVTVISTTDAISQTPIQHAPPHSDHCLTHMTSTLGQVAVAVPIQFGETRYSRRAEVPPADRAGVSPFKPPCA